MGDKVMTPTEWALQMARWHADGPRGPQVCDVIRRYVNGDIPDRSHDRGIVRRDIDADMDEEAGMG